MDGSDQQVILYNAASIKNKKKKSKHKKKKKKILKNEMNKV